MLNEIEQLEKEITEFRGLVKNSSEILTQLNTNTEHIHQLRLDINANSDHIQQLALVFEKKVKRALILGALGISIGGASIVFNLLI